MSKTGHPYREPAITTTPVLYRNSLFDRIPRSIMVFLNIISWALILYGLCDPIIGSLGLLLWGITHPYALDILPLKRSKMSNSSNIQTYREPANICLPNKNSLLQNMFKRVLYLLLIPKIEVDYVFKEYGITKKITVIESARFFHGFFGDAQKKTYYKLKKDPYSVIDLQHITQYLMVVEDENCDVRKVGFLTAIIVEIMASRFWNKLKKKKEHAILRKQISNINKLVKEHEKNQQKK